MLDLNFIRENPDKVKKACLDKNMPCDMDTVLALDKKKRELMTEIETLKAEQNRISRLGSPKPAGEGGVAKPASASYGEAREVKAKIKEMEPDLEKVDVELKALLSGIPNVPFDDVPVGKDDSQNIVLRKVGKPPKFNFQAKEYMELAEALDIIDTKRAAKVSGARFGYIKGQLAILEFAIVKFVLDTLTKEGFVPVIPPVMVNETIARGTGFIEGSDRQDCYYLPDDDLYLTGTSEQSLVGMHTGEVFEEKDLPRRYVGFSTCFRREAGSYGKDTKGILRVHQFDKLEMVIFSTPEKSKKEHELLLKMEEKLMKALKVPYQVINICTGDLGRPAAKKFDIEAWVPSEGKYRETHSTSNCTDFQARRLNIRYKDKTGKMQFAHTLNGTAFAIGRILIAIIENYQQKDGSIKIPQALQKYAGFSRIAGSRVAVKDNKISK